MDRQGEAEAIGETGSFVFPGDPTVKGTENAEVILLIEKLRPTGRDRQPLDAVARLRLALLGADDRIAGFQVPPPSAVNMTPPPAIATQMRFGSVG